MTDPSRPGLPTSTTISLFTAEEAASLLAQMDDADFHVAKRVSEDGTTQVIDVGYRSCDAAGYRAGHPVYEQVLARIVERLPDINERYQFDFYADPREMLPVIMVNRYNGGHIGMHTDMDELEIAANRKLSLSILLTDSHAFEGGTLIMLDGETHTPLKNAPAGTAAVFPSYVVHSVDEVTSGVRYTIVAWLLGPRFR